MRKKLVSYDFKTLWSKISVSIYALSLLSAFPLAQWASALQYDLPKESLKLIGAADAKLAAKLVWNEEEKLYQFNSEGKKPAEADANDPEAVARQLAAKQVTGKADDKGLYSLDLPQDASQGMTITDNNLNLSFKMVPLFEKKLGKKNQDRLIYPLGNGATAIYTVKGNGLKEDIVYERTPKGGRAEHSYRLELPDSLVARLDESGNLGIYSADPALFGDISYSADNDREKVESARLNAEKTYLVFQVPKPVIITKHGEAKEASAKFILDDDVLKVVAIDLDTIKGSFSIDPSVVVTSSSDFTSGNNEGNIKYGTDEISRARLSGGDTGSYAAGGSLATAKAYMEAAVVYDYIYVVGGFTGTKTNYTEFASINPTTGAIGSWSPTTVLPEANQYFGMATYNGFVYVLGGDANTVTNAVRYSKVDSATGQLGAWTPASSFTTGRFYNRAVAVNGFLYLIGGSVSANTAMTDVQYAPIRADGSLGTWVPTSTLNNARGFFGVAAYNGYIYAIGGESGTSQTPTVEYTKVKADGSLEPWMLTTSFSQNLTRFPAAAINGYLYALGGGSGSNATASNVVQYAQINANGSIGPWLTGTSFPNARYGHVGGSYKDKVFVVGGAASGPFADSQYATIKPAGGTSPFSATTALPTTRSKGTDYGVTQHETVTHNGYIYAVGGRSATASTAVRYAPISADGTIGAWITGNSYAGASSGHEVVIVNGYMYVIGGYIEASGITANVQYALINSDGSVGTFAAATGLPVGRDSHAVVAYNNYIYVISGNTPGTGIVSSIIYANVNDTGGGLKANSGCGTTWCTTTSFIEGLSDHQAVVLGGYLYVIGGFSSATVNYNPYVDFARLNNPGLAADSGCGTTWCSATNMPQERTEMKAEAYNGYIYVTAGQNNSGLLTDVIYAKQNPDGTTAADSGCGSAWCSAASMSSGRESYGGAIYQGKLYVTGGMNTGGTFLSEVLVANIGNGGVGTLSAFTGASNFNSARTYHATVAYNGYLYVIGGYNGSTYFNDVLYAPISANGTTGTWQYTCNSATTPSFTCGFATARAYHGAVVHNNVLYVVGGYNGTDTDSVQKATINADGTIGAWSADTNLAIARDRHTTLVNNDYIYVVGGYDTAGNYLSDIQYSPIGPGGITGWSPSGNFTTGRVGHSSVIVNGYLYVMGGYGGTYLDDVQYAPINSSTGVVGNWSYTSRLPSARNSHASVALNGYIYVMGGTNATRLDDVQVAAINSNGALSNWSSTTKLTTLRYGHAAAVYNGNVYYTGGYDVAYVSSTNFASLQSINRSSLYSKVVDLGSATTLGNISYAGTLPGGKDNITYRAAGIDGIYGSALPSTALGGTCATGTAARYVHVQAWLDDSKNAVFGDVGTQASLQDITLEYLSGGGGPSGVDPAKRLRGGKTFTAEALQGLDTLKIIGSGGGGGGC